VQNPKPPKPRAFYLDRIQDESGVSGTGAVATGAIMPSGRAVMEWITKKTPTGSLGVYDSIDDLEGVHGHNGKSKVRYFDEA
jgi:hypothetical protein